MWANVAPTTVSGFASMQDVGGVVSGSRLGHHHHTRLFPRPFAFLESPSPRLRFEARIK